jgi:hypothetical protein
VRPRVVHNVIVVRASSGADAKDPASATSFPHTPTCEHHTPAAELLLPLHSSPTSTFSLFIMASFLSAVGRLLGFVQNEPPASEYTPKYDDVCQARAYLNALDLPTELVLQILEYAQYWPQYEITLNFGRPKIAAAQMGRPSHATLCVNRDIMDHHAVHTARKHGETPKIKSVAFDMVSRDQAWTSENTHGTFSTSSWLEVSILRRVGGNDTALTAPRFSNTWFNNPSDLQHSVSGQGWTLVKRPESAKQGPQDGEGGFAWYLQGNRVAVGIDEYRVVWTEDDKEGNEGAGSGEGFLQELKEGDRILVWARAMVRLLSCKVASAKLICAVPRMAMHRRECQDHSALWLLKQQSVRS